MPVRSATRGLFDMIQPFGIPGEFILFGIMLAAVALLHRHTLAVALIGLVAITAFKVVLSEFRLGTGITGLGQHLRHEWVGLANLFLLLTGFAILSNHFEKSRVPDEMPAILPDGWTGGLMLLVLVFALSSFLDNIAAAMIGGAMVRHVFSKFHIGYLAAIVAAANAGGSGSVIGDTTTTMMWISGVSPIELLPAYVAAGIALLIFGVPAAIQQQNFSPILKKPRSGLRIEWVNLSIVIAILVAALASNVIANSYFPAILERAPVIGLAVWVVILISAPFRGPDWAIMPETFRGSVFLISLVICASMMPVERLPSPGWETALGLGFVSAVFDNIPLTALALKQGGYDWAYLAYCVGFGGSITWFGSSAGVALANLYPEAKSVGLWVRHGWYISVAYVVGFFVMLSLLGWHPRH